MSQEKLKGLYISLFENDILHSCNTDELNKYLSSFFTKCKFL